METVRLPTVRVIVGVLVLTPLLAGAGCTGDGGGASSGRRSESIAGERVEVHGEVNVAGGPVRASIHDNYFEPNVVRARRGSTVTLDLNNDGRALHNVSVADQGVDTDIQPAGSRSIDITVPTTGEVVFFCKYHRKRSDMVGVVRAS